MSHHGLCLSIAICCGMSPKAVSAFKAHVHTVDPLLVSTTERCHLQRYILQYWFPSVSIKQTVMY